MMVMSPLIVANIARLKPAYQSSTGGSASAGRAVDGDTNSIWTGNSCTHTDEEDNPTWYVDLGETSKVARYVHGTYSSRLEIF